MGDSGWMRVAFNHSRRGNPSPERSLRDEINRKTTSYEVELL